MTTKTEAAKREDAKQTPLIRQLTVEEMMLVSGGAKSVGVSIGSAAY